MGSSILRGRQGLTLVAVSLGMFLVQLDVSIVNVALPKIGVGLGAGVSGLQWVVDAYALVFASLLLAAGGLADLYGRRRLFLLGLAVFAAGSVVCGAAPTLGPLAAGRAVQGLGATLQLSSSLSILSVAFPEPKARAQAVGVWAGIGSIALVAGPIIGGLLVDGLGWQSIFWVNLPVALAAIVPTLAVVQESANPEGRRLDLPGQVLSALFLGSLVYALIEGDHFGWGSTRIVGGFVVAAVSLAAFLWVEHRSEGPLLQIRFFRNPAFAAANAAAVLLVFGIYGIIFVFTLFLQGIEGHSAIGAGLLLVPASGAVMVGSPLAGRLAGRYGARLPLVVGMALSAAGDLLLATVGVGTDYRLIVPVLLLIGLGGGFALTSYVAAAIGAVPRERAGMASGVINTSRQTGGAIGVATLGAILSTRLTGTLFPALSALGLSAAAQRRVAAAAGHGGAIAGVTLPAGVTMGAVRQAVDHAFVTGMHTAFLVAGIAAVAGALLSLLCVSRPVAVVTTMDERGQPRAELTERDTA